MALTLTPSQTIAGWIFAIATARTLPWIVFPKATSAFFFSGEDDRDRILDSTVPILLRLFGTFGTGIALSVAFALVCDEKHQDDSVHRRIAIALCILPRMLYAMTYATSGVNHPSFTLDKRKVCIFLIGFMFPTYSLVTGALNPFCAGIFFALKSALMGAYYFSCPQKFFTPLALISVEEEFVIRRGAMYTFISFVWIVTYQTFALDTSTAIGASALTWGFMCCHQLSLNCGWDLIHWLLIVSLLVAFAIAAIEFS